MTVLPQHVQSVTEVSNLSGVSGKSGSGSVSDELHKSELSLFCGGDKSVGPI